MGLKKMTDAEYSGALEKIPGWNLTQKGEISKTFEFRNFSESMMFTNATAFLAEKANHHSDILIQWNCVTLTVVTHDAGGLTEKDFQLAFQIETLIRIGIT